MSESPFIVALKFSFQTPTDLYLVTDYMSGGELFWHFAEGRPIQRATGKILRRGADSGPWNIYTSTTSSTET